MRYGVIDLGANTIRLVVYHVEQNSILCIFSKKETARAVTYRREDIMTPEGVRVISQALRALTRHAALFDLERLWCFATAGLRGLVNQSAVLEDIASVAGIDIEVLSAEQEAAFGVAGFLSVHEAKDALILDLGGGSLELSLIRSGKTIKAASLPIGSVAEADRHVSGIFPRGEEVMHIVSDVRRALAALEWLRNCGAPAAYAMGGSARAMCRVHRVLSGSKKQLEAWRISAAALEPLQTWLLSRKLESIRLIDRHCPGRLFSLLPAIIIFRQVIELSGVPELRLCAAGLREGYLYHKLATL